MFEFWFHYLIVMSDLAKFFNLLKVNDFYFQNGHIVDLPCGYVKLNTIYNTYSA